MIEQLNAVAIAARAIFEKKCAAFEVFLPPDNRISPFVAKPGHSFDERNIAWWATKRGIDLKRIRNIHWERNQCVFSVMLPWSGAKKRILSADGYAVARTQTGQSVEIAVSQIHPANFYVPGGVFRTDYEQPLR